MKFISILILALPVSGFAQGPLVPPGAPAPTMKSLDQIEPRVPISALPFTISSSGSYFLTGNLIGSAGFSGITIDADGVTLDLGGFEMTGNGGTNGIHVLTGRVNATVKNGSLRNWAGLGFNVASTTLNIGMRVERLNVRACGGGGISLGFNGTAVDCYVTGNAGRGITGNDRCKAIDCTATGQTGITGSGIKLGSTSIIGGCVAQGNAAGGLEVADGGSIHHCASSNNTGVGIRGVWACSITDSSASFNTGGGIITENSATIRGCSVDANSGGSGISTSDGSVISECTVRSQNQDASTASGISAGAECRISACVVSDGITSAGISVGDGSIVSSCTVRGNRSDGIRATARCRISENNCSGNGNGGDGAGIHIATSPVANATGNHIDGNTVSDNDRGIDIDAADNVIIRNTAYNNTIDFVFVANNNFGQIINLTSVGAVPAVSGSGNNSSAMGTVDAHANFSK